MWRTVGWLVLVAFSIAVWLATFRAFGFAPAVPGSDAWNYLAAGERLNAGHPLYSISPGDRPIQLLPPYWMVPLLAPPPIAVVWRPLALLGDASMTLWAAAGLAVTLVTDGWLLTRGGLIAAAILAVMAGPLALQSLAGNANGFLFAALVLAWLFRSRPVLAGALVAATIAVKLTPALLVMWLAAAGRWRALGGTVGALVVIGIVSLLGAGLQNHLDWLASVPRSAPVPTSIAGLTGLPSILVEAAAVVAVLVVALARDERLTFSAAVIAAALASPALYLGTLGIAAAAAAPWLPPASSLPSRLRSRSMSTRPA